MIMRKGLSLSVQAAHAYTARLVVLLALIALVILIAPRAAKAQSAVVLHLTRSLVVIDEGGVGYFALHLDAPPAQGERITITPIVSDPSQIAVSPASRTFNASNWSALRTFEVYALDDSTPEVFETNFVRFYVESSLTRTPELSPRVVDIYVNDND